MSQYLIDTNVLLAHPEILNNLDDEIIIHSIVVEEIDNIIHSVKHDDYTKYQARKARTTIKEAKNKTYSLHYPVFSLPLGWDHNKNDNSILAICKDLKYTLVTNDLAMQIKADAIDVKWIEYNNAVKFDNNYKGYTEVVMSEFDMGCFYECMANKWNIKINEYLVIKEECNGNVVDKLKWTEKGFKALNFKAVDSRYVGKVKPRNLQQELYMDMLQDKESKVKIVQGGYGTGKDYLALSNFLQMVEKNQYNKIIWVRNNIEAADSKPIGYLPGSLTEKLSVFADIVGDFVGDNVGFEMLLNSGKLELVHTGFLRGRDLRNSIIYCTEAQNMSSSLVKLILSRVSEGSIAFFNGDVKQIDDVYFKKNNGLELLVNKLQGNSLFGYVYLDKCERSEVAQLASLLDC
jgi:PhoH-like ATPase